MTVERQPRIAFAILAHERPGDLVELANALTARGDLVAIHFDKQAGDGPFGQLTEALRDNPNVLFCARHRCAWGEFSLVAATLEMLRTLDASGQDFDYVYLLSGADLPIRPLSELRSFLQGRPRRTSFSRNFSGKAPGSLAA